MNCFPAAQIFFPKKNLFGAASVNKSMTFDKAFLIFIREIIGLSTNVPYDKLHNNRFIAASRSFRIKVGKFARLNSSGFALGPMSEMICREIIEFFS